MHFVIDADLINLSTCKILMILIKIKNSIATHTENFFAIYKRVTKTQKSPITDWRPIVNKDVKLWVCMISEEFSQATTIFFMTIGLCALCAWVVCESHLVGNADYCMIVCD